MKTIKNSKEITILEKGDKVVFGNLTCRVVYSPVPYGFFLNISNYNNDRIFEILNIDKIKFIRELGITADFNCDFPVTRSLEALTVIVFALFKEYERQNELPKTWEEFCERNPIQNGECYIDRRSNIEVIYNDDWRDSKLDRNICTSEQEAEAFLALMQLRQLRKCYIKDWEPNWNMSEIKYVIKVAGGNCFQIIEKDFEVSSLSFPTYKLARQFIINFKDLLEIAKPLL